jgi:hypothetical protein
MQTSACAPISKMRPGTFPNLAAPSRLHALTLQPHPSTHCALQPHGPSYPPTLPTTSHIHNCAPTTASPPRISISGTSFRHHAFIQSAPSIVLASPLHPSAPSFGTAWHLMAWHLMACHDTAFTCKRAFDTLLPLCKTHHSTRLLPKAHHLIREPFHSTRCKQPLDMMLALCNPRCCNSRCYPPLSMLNECAQADMIPLLGCCCSACIVHFSIHAPPDATMAHHSPHAYARLSPCTISERNALLSTPPNELPQHPRSTLAPSTLLQPSTIFPRHFLDPSE